MIRSEMLAAPLPRLAISLGGAGQACLLRKTSVEDLTLPSPHDEAKLARDIVPICDDDPSDVRQAYRQFVPPIVDLFNGEEVFEDFFHQYVYASFGSDDVESGAAGKALEKRNELESIMSYSRVFFYEFVQTNAEDVGENGKGEFGASFNFKPPLRFIIDTSLDDGLPSESGGLDSTSFNSTAIGGSVDLMWLKDWCNLITSSMLSGDKLAMALCRVLSNKSNNELAGELLDLIDNAAYEIPHDLLYIEYKKLHSHLCVLTDTLNKARTMKNISGGEILHGLLKVVAEGHSMLIEKKSQENHNEEREHQIIAKEMTKKKLIFIDSMDGRLSIFVDMNYSCVSLKKLIEKELGYSLKNFTLRFGYKILENHMILHSYGLSQFSVLNLYPKLLGGCEGDQTLAQFLGSGVQLIKKITIPDPYSPGQTLTVDNLNASGCRLAKSLVDIFMKVQREGLSWNGLIELNDFKVHHGRAEVTKPATRNHGTDGWIMDCKKLATMLKIIFKAKGANPLYLSGLLDILEGVKREYVLFEWFRIYVQTHFTFTPSDNREKVSYQLMKMYESMSPAQQNIFEKNVNRVSCHVWKNKLAQSAYIFKGTMRYRINQCGKPYPITSFGCFKFQRNFTTHASEEKVNGIAKFPWNRLEYVVQVVLGDFVPKVIMTLLEKGYDIGEILTSSVPN